jgi:hypothetical protein
MNLKGRADSFRVQSLGCMCMAHFKNNRQRLWADETDETAEGRKGGKFKYKMLLFVGLQSTCLAGCL